MADYTGEYREVTRRFPGVGETDSLRVVLDEGVLYTRWGSRRRALIPVTATLFRRGDEAVPTSAFVRDERGALYLQGNVGNYRRVENLRGRAPARE